MCAKPTRPIPRELWFDHEPRGFAYQVLMKACCKYGDSFSLVCRHDVKFDPSVEQLHERLREHMLEKKTTAEWPGTTLLGGAAIVRKYRLTEVTARELSRADGLYRWRHPAQPEDLAIYIEGVPLLGTVAHEQMAFLNTSLLPPEELAKLLHHLWANGVLDTDYAS